MKRRLAAALTLCLCAWAAAGQGLSEPGDDASPNLEAGVPRELARWRARHYRDVRYSLDVRLAPGAGEMRGAAKVSVTLAAPVDLVFDWRSPAGGAAPRERVSAIRANGRPVDDARFEAEHMVVPRRHLAAGTNEVEFSFAAPVSTSGSALTRYLDREDGSEYVYTLFVPSDASTIFPCFDQPDLKARFRLAVEAPANWTVVANTRAPQEPKAAESPGTRRTLFPETEPISTYVFAFAAGPFAELKDEASAHSTRLFVRKSKIESARREAAELFRLNRVALRYFEGYFDRAFPFSKYDLVVIPEFAFNGMEHAGATFLREERVLFQGEPTATEVAYRAYLMFHEAAHQWFGDLVTMEWFDDLWLKEGFATFMGYKAVAEALPQFDPWKLFYLTEKPLAYQTDVTKGTTAIFQVIANLSAAKSAYGNIVYRKAPSVLRQAEFYLGEREFRDAVRLFVREHAYANATWADLVRAFERTSGRELDAWADAWVRRRGMPDVRVRWSADRRGRISRMTVEQRDVLGEGGAWPMKVELALVNFTSKRAVVRRQAVTLEGAGPTEVREVVGRAAPSFVFANYGDFGYGRFLLDEAGRAAAAGGLGRVREDFLRALVWGSLWDSVREAEMAPAEFVRLATVHAPRERDDVALQFVLSRAVTAHTRYLSEGQRRVLGPPFERMLRAGAAGAATAGERLTYLRAYRDAAGSPEALDLFAAAAEDGGRALRLKLGTRDRFDLVRALTAAGDARAPKLSARLLAEDDSNDARRYAYAAAAARPDAAVKRNYFEQYFSDRALPESWVEASLAPFNSPRQGELTRPFLAPALKALPELKQTRKIFFINNWLAAFLGGQCGGGARAEVAEFLARERLDPDLRLKVLEAADGLERCVRIRARHAAPAAP
ncbi:MAG TPA: M1 family aminopeptidase [Pyrinomonadaceae bacterium]|nr:M1 family aminopeptidase [Pyrinomonadaceae bacterium]